MGTIRMLKRAAPLMTSAWQAIAEVPLHEPADGLAEIKVMPGGSTSCTSTFRSGVVPSFSNRMVNVAACPCTSLSVAGSTKSAKGAPAMNVVRLTSLFEESGSLSAATWAVAMLAEPEGAPPRTIAAIDAGVPAAIVVAVQVRTLVFWQLSDAGAVNESSVENGGGVKVNTTCVASAGPLFTTLSAYTAIAPLSTTAGTCP